MSRRNFSDSVHFRVVQIFGKTCDVDLTMLLVDLAVIAVDLIEIDIRYFGTEKILLEERIQRSIRFSNILYILLNLLYL